jgi:hypothetical protein
LTEKAVFLKEKFGKGVYYGKIKAGAFKYKMVIPNN